MGGLQYGLSKTLHFNLESLLVSNPLNTIALQLVLDVFLTVVFLSDEIDIIGFILSCIIEYKIIGNLSVNKKNVIHLN